ncbi:MAG: MFS transporter [Clostridia bacterium]
MGIMCFWEVYDYIMPLILNRVFGLSASNYGLVMGLDNMLAIVLLPLFGSLSDKAKPGKSGKRTKFIFWGTLIAVVFIVILSLVEFAQYRKIMSLGINELDKLTAYGLDQNFLGAEYKALVDQVASGVKLQGNDLAMYNSFLDAKFEAQLALAAATTKANPAIAVCFIAVLVLLLVAMGSFRSPAVALMPDVTPKPLRSQANAVITFMGGAGGMASMLLYKALAKERYQSHIALFLVLGGVMLAVLVAYLCTVRENKFVAQRFAEEKQWNIVDEEEKSGDEKLGKKKMISLLLILFTVFFWFMGFNAVKTHLSVYGTTVLKFTDGFIGTINLINGIGGAIALVPVAIMAAKWGRKATIAIGLVISIAAYVPCFFMTASTPFVQVWFPLCFILSGFSLVCVNVNTFPMVAELSKGSNVGKYTGFYYIFAMVAQAITPYFAGLVIENISERSMFVYAIIFVIIATITISFTKHGDNKPPKKAKMIEYFSED